MNRIDILKDPIVSVKFGEKVYRKTRGTIFIWLGNLLFDLSRDKFDRTEIYLSNKSPSKSK